MALCGLGTEGATASPLALALAADGDATWNDAGEPEDAEPVAMVITPAAVPSATVPSATFSTAVSAIDGVDETVAPRLVETSADVVGPTPAPLTKTLPRKLPDEERAAVPAVLHDDRFCNLAPAAVWATLLDEGRHLCSVRTMYRILDENRELRERRNQRRHPAYAAPS